MDELYTFLNSLPFYLVYRISFDRPPLLCSLSEVDSPAQWWLSVSDIEAYQRGTLWRSPVNYDVVVWEKYAGLVGWAYPAWGLPKRDSLTGQGTRMVATLREWLWTRVAATIVDNQAVELSSLELTSKEFFLWSVAHMIPLTRAMSTSPASDIMLVK